MSPDDPRHGTEPGFREHHRRGATPPCEPCLRAHMRANKFRILHPSKTSSLGSQRRIRALQAIGYGRNRIARELGYATGGSIAYLMRSETLLIVTADKIADVYDRLCMTPPDGDGPSRARMWAKRHGHAPPLAWDDIDNDVRPARRWERPNPASDEIDHAVVWRVLDGDVLHTTRAERFEIMRQWRERGGSVRALCDRMGWSDNRYQADEDVA